MIELFSPNNAQQNDNNGYYKKGMDKPPHNMKTYETDKP